MVRLRPVVVVLLVLGMGLGLHAAFRGLGRELPEAFPHLTRETRLPSPLILEEEEENTVAALDEPEPPADAIPLKRSGEEISLVPKLLSPSQLPDFSHVGRAVTERFEPPPQLAPMVDFWKKVYAVYGSNQVVLHDSDYPAIEYGILDFSDLNRRNLSEPEKRTAREAAIKAAAEKVRSALTELETREGFRPLSLEAQRISSFFRNIPDPQKYKKAKDSLRSQTGLKDRFAQAIKRSGRYLPLFEEVFAHYGVPREITRLAFVESMFQERAASKANAVGLWQFMAGTARRYMIVEKHLDERYDPIVASHGAARLLLRNYELLGTWPLAINAYNSGPGNLQKAIQKLGTRDIGRIATEYKSSSYAFASRNFYPSFLAALDVYENQERYFGRIVKDPIWRFDQVRIPSTMSFPEMAFLSDSSLENLKELNPAFSSEVFEGKFSLPAGSQIRIPTGKQPIFASRFVQYSSNQISSMLTPAIFHVVNPGESYADIAAQYGVPFQDLRRANTAGPDADTLATGQVLMIPSATNLVQN